MTELERAIAKAYATQGERAAVMRVHKLLLSATLWLPIEKDSTSDNPKSIYMVENDYYFVPVFAELNYLNAWAEEISQHIKSFETSGLELVSGLNSNTYLCLNPGSANYKEFSPPEIAKLRIAAGKIRSLIGK